MTKEKFELYFSGAGVVSIAFFFVWLFITVSGNNFGWIQLTGPAVVVGGAIGLGIGILICSFRANLIDGRTIKKTLGFCFVSTLYGSMLSAGLVVGVNRLVPVTQAEPRILTITSFGYHRSGVIVNFTDAQGNQYAHRFKDKFKEENPVGAKFLFHIHRGLFGQEFFTEYKRLQQPSNVSLNPDTT